MTPPKTFLGPRLDWDRGLTSAETGNQFRRDYRAWLENRTAPRPAGPPPYVVRFGVFRDGSALITKSVTLGNGRIGAMVFGVLATLWLSNTLIWPLLGLKATSEEITKGNLDARAFVKGRDEIATLQDGEILVAPTTSPSWAPAFIKIKACVTDVGGVMSHAAIVCREYGMPAVVGTGHATKIIRSGMRVRVDGSTGVVSIVREAAEAPAPRAAAAAVGRAT